MGIFRWLLRFFTDNLDDCEINGTDALPTDYSTSNTGPIVNPATGLPMISGTGGVDVEGNPYGFDLSHDNTFDTESNSDYINSGFYDPFGNDDGFNSSL
ncbi:MAG: hypothetical protein WHS38_01730 [Thermodesulforhabdaceae bacterium]|jgi:hypothetical protein